MNMSLVTMVMAKKREGAPGVTEQHEFTFVVCHNDWKDPCEVVSAEHIIPDGWVVVSLEFVEKSMCAGLSRQVTGKIPLERGGRIGDEKEREWEKHPKLELRQDMVEDPNVPHSRPQAEGGPSLGGIKQG